MTTTEDESKMNGADIASNLGGALGLWLGMSVLSMCEIVELGLQVKWAVSCKKVPNILIGCAHPSFGMTPTFYYLFCENFEK